MSNEAGVFKDSQNMQRLCLKRFTQCILGHLNQYLSVQRLVNIKLILSFWGKVSSYRLCIYILFKRKSKTSLRNAASFSNWQHNVCLLQSKSVWWSKSSKSSEDPTAVLLHYRIKCALQPAGRGGPFFLITPNIWNSISLLSLWPRQPSTITSPTNPSLFTNSKSRREHFLVTESFCKEIIFKKLKEFSSLTHPNSDRMVFPADMWEIEVSHKGNSYQSRDFS